LTIPIATPAGRGGVDLSLALEYQSGAGNGPFGLGFNLSVPSITRKTDKGLPRYLDADESDVFVLAGAEDLVPIPLLDKEDMVDDRTIDGISYEVRRYRPRVEGQFARVERLTRKGTLDSHFRVTTRENALHVYGFDADARVMDPAAPERVFSWLLKEIRDDRGNIVRYSYKPEDGKGVLRSKASEASRFVRQADGTHQFVATAQRYLKCVQYGNRTPFSASGWLFEVVFDYGEHDTASPDPSDRAAGSRPWPVRLDPFSSHRAGFEVRTYRLCRRVLVFHRVKELLPPGTPPPADTEIEATLVRSTDLRHEHNPVLTYLVEVTQAGYVRKSGGGYLRAALPPLALDYTRAEIHDQVTRLSEPQGGVDGGTSQWVDLDGEGIPGVLTLLERAWYYRSNLGQGRLDTPAALRTLPSPAQLRGGFQQLADLSGDGQLDLVRYAAPLAGYFSRRAAVAPPAGTSDLGWEPFRAFRSIPNLDWNDANLRTLDLDGDGLPDVLLTETDAFCWFPSRAKDGFGPGERRTKPHDEDEGPAIVFADGTETILLADMSGDGLVDIVRVRNGEVCYWPNQGYGLFGRKITLENSPWFDRAADFDPKRVRFGDADGSGTSDIFYLGKDGVRVYLNQSGNALSDPVTIRSLPTSDSLSGTSVVDLLGTGMAYLVWSSPAPSRAREPIAYVDLMAGRKPHLLASIKNHLGGETRLEYAPSTRFYLADKAAGQPWITRLAFPLHVVERVVTIDHVGRNRFVSRYAYHHGYFDGVEREFRGFGRVDQWDTEELGALTSKGELPSGDNIDAASYVPPVLTKTWFHTGAYFEGGSVSRAYAAEYYAEGDASEGLSPLTAEQREAMLLPDTVLRGDLSAEERREACRALKGSILRREVYGLDRSGAADRPYLVSEQSYTVERIRERGSQRCGVFFAHPREALEMAYERARYQVGTNLVADPRVKHSFTLAVNAYGDVVRSASVGYGRRHDDPDSNLTARDRDGQRRIWISYTQTDYAEALSSDTVHRGPAPSEERTYEVVKLAPASKVSGITNLFGFDELDGNIDELEEQGAKREIPYEDVTGKKATEDASYRRLIEHTRRLYRSDDLKGPLDPNKQGRRGLLHEAYRLAFTKSLPGAIYGTLVDDRLLTGAGYVHFRGDDQWWIPSGQIFYSPNDTHTTDEELAYAEAHFFQPCRFRDPFQAVTTVTYDDYDLLVRETRDAAGNLSTAGERDATGKLTKDGNDYRVLSPRLVMDANRNRAEVAFDALGLVVGTAVSGKPETPEGDSLEDFEPDLDRSVIAAQLADPLADPHAVLGRATTRVIYDLLVFQSTEGVASPSPVVACTFSRETHDTDLTPPAKSRVQTSLAYFDGLGREIQRKVRAEKGPLIPGGPDVSPRWVGTGWTIFNNKGNPVRKYEPFFTPTHRFQFAAIVGVSPIVFYDPLQRPIATILHNRAFEKIVFDPWRQAAWDAHDTVLITDPTIDPDAGDFFRRLSAADYSPTWYSARISGERGADEQAAAEKAEVHRETPAVTLFDALGRPFAAIAHNRYLNGATPVEERYFTRTTLDIEGNAREVVDARGRPVARYDYDMLGTRARAATMDAGERFTLTDALGKPVRAWDSRGHVFRTEYDALRRPVEVHVTGAVPANPTKEILYQKIEYGEGQTDDVKKNLRGQVYRTSDCAGTLTVTSYDFKGNPLGAVRALAVEYKAPLDWNGTVPLDATTYSTATHYDALSRPIAITSPDQSEVHPTYNEAGLIETISANLRGASTSIDFITNIDYNAKGQRERVERKGGVVTAYTYDLETFRLTRIHTTRSGGSAVLQDIAYTYDAAGNVARTADGAQPAIYFSGSVVRAESDYTYDAIYRLIGATGREHLGLTGGVANDPVATSDSDAPRVGVAHPNDGQAMGGYVEKYTYDQVGNFVELIHRSADPMKPGWTRAYAYEEDSLLVPAKDKGNRLSYTQVGAGPKEAISYDAHGNMVKMPHLPILRWDCKEQLQATTQQSVTGGKTPELTYYVYDFAGERVRKVTERQADAGKPPTRKGERVYLGGFEVYREFDAAGTTITLERETLHIHDADRRAALVETRTAGDDGTPSQLIRFQHENLIGSACLELDETATILTYEEYYPYGSTSYQGVRKGKDAAKRYRYTAKERDEENGLSYHGARYYAPWLGRWTSPDPAGFVDGTNVYAHVRGNPLRLTDPTGRNATSETRPADDPRNYTKSDGTRVIFEKSTQSHGGGFELTGYYAFIGLDAHTAQRLGFEGAGEVLGILGYDKEKREPYVGILYGLGVNTEAVNNVNAREHSYFFLSKEFKTEDIKLLDVDGARFGPVKLGGFIDPHNPREFGAFAYGGHGLVGGGGLTFTGHNLPTADLGRANQRIGIASRSLQADRLPSPQVSSARLTLQEERAVNTLLRAPIGALKLLGRLSSLLGAEATGERVYKETGSTLYGLIGAAAAIPAGLVDDAALLPPFTPVGAPLVDDSYKRYGAGPTQALVGDALILLSQVGRRLDRLRGL
jgi:RHS repeat-associated protein